MSFLRNSDNLQWFILEWLKGGSSAVFITSVMTPLNRGKLLNLGDDVLVDYHGELRWGTITARARDRVTAIHELKELQKKQAGEQIGDQPGVQAGAQAGDQPDAQADDQPGVQARARAGANPGAQPGAQADVQTRARAGAKPGAQPSAQPGVQAGAHADDQAGVQPRARAGAQPGVQVRARAAAQAGVQPGNQPGDDAKENEEEEDFSSSSSSWVPSDDDAASVDSLEVNMQRLKVKITKPPKKPTKFNKKNATRRTKKRVTKPKHRAIALTPKNIKKHVKPKALMNSKKATNPPTRRNLKGIKPAVVDAGLKVRKIFMVLFKMIESLKPKGSAVLEERSKEHKPVPFKDIKKTPFKQSVANLMQHQNEANEEFNRSNDHVLISNKYKNVAVNQNQILNVAVNQNQILNVTNQNRNEIPIMNGSGNRNRNQIPIMNRTGNRNQNRGQRNDDWVRIGSGKTIIHKDKYRTVNWKSYTIATRTLLLAVFPRKTLATHSLTGKRSPAFQNKPAKMCLDPKKTTDVIIEITDRFRVKESLVRSIITTKCADEAKMRRTRISKRRALKQLNKENMPPPGSPESMSEEDISDEEEDEEM